MSEVGPDRVIPCDNLTTWKADGCVKIRKQDGDDVATNSIPTFIKKCCRDGGDSVAMCVKREGKWVRWTYNEYYDHIRTAAKGFIKLGLQPFHSVAIYSFNSPEWFISALGCIHAGGFSCGLYPTNSPEMNKFIMNDAKADLLVCEDAAAVEKLWEIKEEVESLKLVIQMTGDPKRPGVVSWKNFMKEGRDETDKILDRRLSNMAINQCAVLIYTSGTTGNPKGVMLSHDNLMFITQQALNEYKWQDKKEVVVSYLPLSHVAAFMFDMLAPMSCKGTVFFADKFALKGSLLEYLKEARPTQFLGVPRVWEKIMEGMLAKGKDVKGMKKKIATSCKQAGLEHYLNNKNGMMYKVGEKLVYSKVKEALGLDRAKGFYTGAAPISMETVKYFLSLDIPIMELFGMSETSGLHSGIRPGMVNLGTVGKPLPHVKTKFDKKTEDGDGEICMWGRNIMMGYLNREDKTTEEIDNEGYLHSGDMASMDKEGFITITGRIKELLITAGGENVAPIPIEETIKQELPIISNAILIGDKKKFLSVFLTLKTVIDMKTETPTKELTPSAQEWCSSIGRPGVKTVEDVLSGPDPVIMAQIQEGIDRANKKAVSNAARVQRWTILPMDVSVPGGELGPTLKLKRFAFNKKYDDAIDRLYA